MRITIRKSVVVGVMLVSAAVSSFAGDADVKLTTADGSTKFTVQDSNGNVVTSVSSQGNVTISSNTVLRGATFYNNAPNQISTSTIQIYQLPVATIRTTAPSGVGLLYYCQGCTGTLCVSTGTTAGSFAAITSTKAVCQ